MFLFCIFLNSINRVWMPPQNILYLRVISESCQSNHLGVFSFPQIRLEFILSSVCPQFVWDLFIFVQLMVFQDAQTTSIFTLLRPTGALIHSGGACCGKFFLSRMKWMSYPRCTASCIDTFVFKAHLEHHYSLFLP